MPSQPSKTLETFDNPHPERDYIIEIETPEFTCLCPKTGQPDFATLYLTYVPDRKCVELKSLKLYVWSYRDEGAFHEAVTNKILSDLVQALAPRYMRLRARFNVRGGVYTTVEAEYRKSGWTPPPPAPDHLPRTRQELPGREQPAAAEAPPAPAAAAQAVPPPAVETDEGIYIGLDLGTTGCRVVAIEVPGTVLGQAEAPIPAPLRHDGQITQDPSQWWKAASNCLERLCTQIETQRVRAIAVAATSGTMLLCDAKGQPLTPAMMYNDARAVEQARRIQALAGRDNGAQGATSSLAKLLWLHDKRLDKKAAHVLQQADWIVGKLTGRWGVSDYNNCLKLGYDAHAGQWPDWLATLGVDARLLPQVHTPGETVGTLGAELGQHLGLPAGVRVTAGTTDGVAAFLAAGATAPGHGVTSLGSTLVLKLLSERPVFSPEHGVYSHRLGKYWLAGGASNSGGAVLLQYFNVEQMRAMTPLLDPESLTGLEYYPLPDTGERFPINDPAMAPKLEPLPSDSVTFFQGMLEGIARIEAQGYRLLTKLGAPPVTAVYTTGGGSRNPAWTRLRERVLKVKMLPAHSQLTAYGAALLAYGAVEKIFE